MWEYLARNLKANVDILVPLNSWVYRNWRRHAYTGDFLTGNHFDTDISVLHFYKVLRLVYSLPATQPKTSLLASLAQLLSYSEIHEVNLWQV